MLWNWYTVDACELVPSLSRLRMHRWVPLQVKEHLREATVIVDCSRYHRAYLLHQHWIRVPAQNQCTAIRKSTSKKHSFDIRMMILAVRC